MRFLPAPALCFVALAVAGSGVLAQAVADVPPPPRLVSGNAVAAPAAPTVTAGTASAALAAAPAQTSAPVRAASAVPSNIRVIEDDEVRIEETRGQRGQLQRITVRNKTSGAKGYEIIVGPAGQDPSQQRGNSGQRAWSLFDF